MSFANAHFSLPPGDRDDAPIPPPLDPLAGLESDIALIGKVLRDGIAAFSELHRARAENSALAMSLAANKLAAAMKPYTRAKARSFAKKVKARRQS